MLRISACWAALCAASLFIAPAQGQTTCIDFDSLVDGEVVTDQFPGVTFWSDPGFLNRAVSGTLGTSGPNYICTGAIGSMSLSCEQRTFIRFVPAVKNLSFQTVFDDAAGVIGKCDVYVQDIFAATIDIIGDGNPFTSEVVDLSAFEDVSRIRLRGITDISGLGWDDFCFESSCPTGDNDDCFCAEPIFGEGLFAFDNSMATTDGVPDPLCDEFGTSQVPTDIWFAWTPDETCDYSIETCFEAVFDSKVALYSGDCSDFSVIDCNDDSCDLQSRVVGAQLQAGTTYRIRVGTFPGASGGAGNLKIDKIACGEITNNDCETAEAISGTGIFVFDNTFGTTDGPPEPLCKSFGTSQISKDVWFRWTPPCNGDFTVSTCFLAVNDTRIAVYDGINCGNSNVIACNDDAPDDLCDVQSQVMVPGLVGGEEYLIRIGSFPGTGGNTGLFLITGATEGGDNYCMGGINLDGETASMSFAGTTSVAMNNFMLVADGVSSQAQFGLFVMGDAQTNFPFGQGFLCVQPNNNFYRLIPVIGFNNVDQVTRPVDFLVNPTDNITPASTWNFQFWYRDLGQTNLSDAISVCFGP